MVSPETFVLSDLKRGEALGEFITWRGEIKARDVRNARLVVSLVHENLPMALLWHAQRTTSRSALTHGHPFIDARIEGGNSLAGLLVWLGTSSLRTIGPGATVTVPHFMEYGSPLHAKVIDAVAGHVTFTDIDVEPWGDTATYRRARASMLIDGSRIIDRHDLKKHFATLPGAP